MLAALVSHDGLHDSLTGLLSLPAFLDSATRIISSTIRSAGSVNLFLGSLLVSDNSNAQRLAISEKRELACMSESEIGELAARIVTCSGILRSEFREGDLVARYTFGDFLILTSGDYDVINKKIESFGIESDVAIVGARIDLSQKDNTTLGAQSVLLSTIAALEALQSQRI